MKENEKYALVLLLYGHAGLIVSSILLLPFGALISMVAFLIGVVYLFKDD